MITSEKQLLRNRIRRAVAGLSEAARRSKSGKIRHHLRALPEFLGARVIYGFYPTAREPDWIGEHWPAGSELYLPKLEGRRCAYAPADDLDALKPGPFGIPQPATNAEHCPPPDIILVPGLGFDLEGRRLGRGGGFMDRMLHRVKGLRVGIAFSIQVIGHVPVAAHDEPMDGLITETGFLPCSGGSWMRRG
jgi:5-formyltetrahydrofolate cyclo-ligase